MSRAHAEYVLRATIVERPGELLVQVDVPEGTADRTYVAGWTLPLNRRALAERLVRAIHAGVALVNPTKKKDVFGKTYVSAEPRVLGRTLNADLKREGF